MECLVSILPLESIQSLCASEVTTIWRNTNGYIIIIIIIPWDAHSVQEKYLLKSSATSDVRYCVIKTNNTPQCWCGLASDILKKSKLNWKLKICNTADNAGITQSQARDTRYRRMQELNSLCVSK